jgi:prolycopene isomerase
MNTYDAIVIGSGNAGLTAATALQRGGAQTLLLERHNIPGGCATSFVRGEFEFEVALHQLSGMGTEEEPFVLRNMFADLGIMDDLDVIIERDLYRYVIPGEIDVTLPADWSELQKVLIERFPSEAETIPAFMTLAETLLFEAFVNVPQLELNNDPIFLDTNCLTYKRYGLRPAKEVIHEFFSDPDLIAILTAYWCYLGASTQDLPFRDMAAYLYVYAKFKPTYIKGGSQAISSAMLESFQVAGGKVIFNCGAEKILTEDNKVCGVISEAGETFRAKTIISNASPIQTYYELLDIDAAPDKVVRDMKSRRIGTSAFVLYLGLDCLPEKLGITSASTFINQVRDEELILETMATLNTPLGTMVTCYSIEDPSAAPVGKTSLSLLCLQYAEPWDSVSEADYAATKYRLADEMIMQAEEVFPGIREHIEEVEVATPLTMMRFLNTPGGAIYGFHQNSQDGSIFRESLDAIEGLYLASAWTSMGGFQPTYTNGNTAGLNALKYIQKIKGQHEVPKNA